MNSASIHTLETRAGRLAGFEKEGILRFCGIPYAKPPVGPLRWRMAEPAEPWAGVREALRFGPIAPQAPSALETLMGAASAAQSEDCLYLNVWTASCEGKRPVMVWLHGGAFIFGAGSQGLYNGKRLAARGVVVVTVNYRLGALGFLNLRDAGDGALPGTGAEGLADQLLALEWVKANIAQFGGDPDNVTLFGESAGAMSTAAHLSNPRGLFHKAIAQSGAAHIGLDRERSARVAQALLKKLGLSGTDAAHALAAPYAKIVNAQTALLADTRLGRGEKLGQLPFQPTIDGEVLSVKPIEAVRAGAARGIPLLTGTTREEWKLFSAANPATRIMRMRSFEARIGKLAGPGYAEAMLEAYGEGSAFERFAAMMTDKVFAVPAIRLLEAQGACAPVFAYRFDWASKLLGGIMGSCHALDIGFVFGSYDVKLASAFFGKGPKADALSEAMQKSWVAFAASGDPATDSTGDWPGYDVDSRATMMFGDGAPHVARDPNPARRQAWNPIPERRLGP